MTDMYSDTYWTAGLQITQAALARLAPTDRLIDLIVYRLYGLSEEEVTIVEGSAS